MLAFITYTKNMEINYSITIYDKNTYENIHSILRNELQISNRLLSKLIEKNCIFLNDSLCDTRNSFEVNDTLIVNFDYSEDNTNVVPTKMDLEIIYEDDAYIVLNKPAGIPVHPSMEHYTDSLSNGLKYYFESIGLKRKIRPVNRLDKNTSGLVVFAKNEYIQECLVRQMKENQFYKEYIAICEGKFNKESGVINAPISRKENSIIERCISKNGDTAITKYTVLTYNEDYNYSVVKCVLKTGRTHQIRVHMKYIGHPILGDTLYGNPSKLINRQALHSHIISFNHPINKKNVTYTAPLFSDMSL